MKQCCANCKCLNNKGWCSYNQDWLPEDICYSYFCSHWNYDAEFDD